MVEPHSYIQNKYLEKFEELYKTTNLSNFDIDYEEYVFYLNEFLESIKNNEHEKKISEIDIFLNNYGLPENIFFEEFNFSRKEKNFLFAIIIYKSLNRISLTDSVHEINYLSSDTVINNFIEYYKNIHIFYFRFLNTHSEIHSLRGFLVRVFKILIFEKIIICKKSFSNNNTLEEWSFGFENIKMSLSDHFKISEKPFKLIKIGDFETENYLIGNFFTLTKKIFVENIKSEHYFKLNDKTYTENMTKNKIYLNKNDLNEICCEMKKKKINLENLYETIKKNNISIKNNINTIKKNKIKIKNILIEESKSYLFNKYNINQETLYSQKIKEKEDFIKIKKDAIDLFYNYIIKTIGSPEINKINKKIFLNSIYELFIKNFDNAFINIEEINDVINYKNSFKEYGIDENYEEINYKEKKIFSKITKTKKKINKKINENLISFLTYIIILKKKEITDIIKKNIKKIIKKKDKLILNNEIILDNIEKNEDSMNNHYLSFLNIIINYKETERDSKIITLNIDNKDFTQINKKLYAEISKNMKYYNVLQFNEYIKNNYKKNKDENMCIYFMFFFDFRGRFYYDSVISPTSNRFCRLIYNYGETSLEKINFKYSEISMIVEKYTYEIKKITEKYKIESELFIVKELIFWILISIGKLTINKSEFKISLDKFIEQGVKNIENNGEIIEDVLDKCEFTIYKKMIKSLKEKKIIRRCLIKDATASFFQNLIRILGPKNNESLKIANLNSNTHWYDWYSYILNKWIEEESKINTKKDVLSFFTRKSIKKIVMTQPYEASYPTLYDYFKNSLLENYNKEIENNSEESKAFKRFYTFLQNLMINEGPFEESIDKITEYFDKILKQGEEIIIISKDDDMSNLTYYKTKTKHFDFIIIWNNEKKRLIKNYKELNKKEMDKEKIKTSIKANLVHYSDALLVRDINKSVYKKNKKYLMSIHDSFLVDFTEISEFIEIANQEANKEIFKEIKWSKNIKMNSIFIFI